MKFSFKEDCSSKKAHTKEKKHCALCEEHGGAPTTRNTGDCIKYKRDGTRKKGFKKRGNSGSGNQNNQNFSQIMKNGFAEMTKALKKDKKSKKRCKYDSNSDIS